MVARSEDKARTVTDRINSTSTRLDEVVRAQGRGAPAIRDSAGNVLEMNPDAPYPLLTPQNIDAAVAFTPDGTVKITSADTSEDRDMTVATIHASNSIGTSGNFVAQGDVNVVGHSYSSGLTVFGDAVANWFHSTGNINADVSIAAGLNVIANGVILTSDAALKSHVRDLDDDPGLFDGLRPRRYRRHVKPEQDELGFVAQELPDELQRSIPERGDVLGYDAIHVLAVAVAEIKRQKARIDDLESRLAALEGA